MYRHNEKQIQFENFKLPFSGKLRSDNRWVKLSKQIPWQEIEELYSSSLSLSGKGAPALSVRVAFGAMLIVAGWPGRRGRRWDGGHDPVGQHVKGLE